MTKSKAKEKIKCFSPLLIEIFKEFNVKPSVPVNLNDFTHTKNNIKQKFSEMKAIFEDLRK